MITLKINNLYRLQEAFRASPQIFSEEFGTSIRKVVLAVEADAKRKAPVNKRGGGGNLRQSIRSGVTGLTGQITANAHYAPHVEFGTRRHTITVRTARVLTDGVSIFGRKVRHPRTKRQPFMQPALHKNKDGINREFTSAVTRTFSRLLR